MSLKVQNDPSAGVGAAGLNRTGHSAPAGAGAGSGKTGSFNLDGGDQVQVSSVAQSITAGASALSQERATAVSRLSALYAAGKYSVDSSRVSAALVASATTLAGTA